MPLSVMRPANLAPYLSGKKLLGDDATPKQLEEWFKGEMNAYAELETVQADGETQVERSRALNARHYGGLFKGKRNLEGLVFGPADASELKAIAKHFGKWHAVEPAEMYRNKKYYSCPVNFLPVTPANTLKLKDSSVDVVLMLSVLHHIPNASAVLAEAARVLKPGGVLLLREPTVTMGDWSKPRPGLTPNERGLPLPWLKTTLAKIGLTITQAKPAVFAPWDVLVRKFGFNRPYNLAWFIAVDAILSNLTAPFAKYHRPKWYQKFAPAAVLLVARKGS